MKIRFVDRLLIFVAGLLILCLSASVVAECMGVELFTRVIDTVKKTYAAMPLAVWAFAAGCLLISIYCICLTFRRKKGRKGFVMQKTENGELSIALKAVEGLIEKTVAAYPEAKLLDTGMETTKEGLNLKLKIALASDVSIPLTVEAMQRQMRQYLAACTGVEIGDISVSVENSIGLSENSPYRIPEVTGTKTARLEEPAESGTDASDTTEEITSHQRIFAFDDSNVKSEAEKATDDKIIPEFFENADMQSDAEKQNISTESGEEEVKEQDHEES